MPNSDKIARAEREVPTVRQRTLTHFPLRNLPVTDTFAYVMSNRQLARQIARLERAGNDDFQLILTGGAAAFATHELHLLLRRIRTQSRRVNRLRSEMFTVGLCLPLLLLAACTAALAGLRGLFGFFLLAIPFCLGVLIYQDTRAGRSFSCYDHAQRLRGLIQQELARRRAASQ